MLDLLTFNNVLVQYWFSIWFSIDILAPERAHRREQEIVDIAEALNQQRRESNESKA